jgi:hypothetical protein
MTLISVKQEALTYTLDKQDFISILHCMLLKCKSNDMLIHIDSHREHVILYLRNICGRVVRCELLLVNLN